jgi:hypothetical protein
LKYYLQTVDKVFEKSDTLFFILFDKEDKKLEFSTWKNNWTKTLYTGLKDIKIRYNIGSWEVI